MADAKQKPTVHEALLLVMDDVQAIAKKERNSQQNFNFRGIDAVMNAVGPAFRKHGIVAKPHALEYTAQHVLVGQKQTPMNHVVQKVRFTFTGPAGDETECEVWGEAMDAGDKAMSKAHSVAYRTALLEVLTIPTNEPDPDSDTYERSAKQREPLADDKKISAVFGKKKALGMTDKALTAAIKRDFGKDKEHPGDLTASEINTLLDKMQTAIEAREKAAAEEAAITEDLTGQPADDPEGEYSTEPIEF